MSGPMYRERRFRTLSIHNERVPEAGEILVNTSIPFGWVVRTTEQPTVFQRFLKAIGMKNGPELRAQVFVEWCRDHAVELRYIEPDKPNSQRLHRAVQPHVSP